MFFNNLSQVGHVSHFKFVTQYTYTFICLVSVRRYFKSLQHKKHKEESGQTAEKKLNADDRSGNMRYF